MTAVPARIVKKTERNAGTFILGRNSVKRANIGQVLLGARGGLLDERAQQVGQCHLLGRAGGYVEQAWAADQDAQRARETATLKRFLSKRKLISRGASSPLDVAIE